MTTENYSLIILDGNQENVPLDDNNEIGENSSLELGHSLLHMQL